MSDVVQIVVPRELKSPNKWQGRHWRYKHRETQEWEKAVFHAVLMQSVQRGTGLVVLGAYPWPVCTEKRTVSVTRLVPSARNFMRDEDNLRFATKPLNDALKRLKLIHDDSRKWLDQATPTQELSTDGQHYTRIEIR